MLKFKNTVLSPYINEILALVQTAADYPDINVLITGETGTGKERLARYIHSISDRKSEVFCLADCSAISVASVENDFYGNKKGTLRGITKDKLGFLELSNRGTLFLDNVANLPLAFQSKLFRTLEDKYFTRIGDTQIQPISFRLISSTDYNLDKMSRSKLFRPELFQLINTLHIHIPALRERSEFIPTLLLDFVKEFAQKMGKPIPYIPETTLEELTEYKFPGNIRELRNMTERAMMLYKGDSLKTKDFLY